MYEGSVQRKAVTLQIFLIRNNIIHTFIPCIIFRYFKQPNFYIIHQDFVKVLPKFLVSGKEIFPDYTLCFRIAELILACTE